MATTELKENPYNTQLKPIMECVGYDEVVELPIYVLDIDGNPMNDAFGNILGFILEVEQANKYGLRSRDQFDSKNGDYDTLLGFYGLPETPDHIYEKIASGELLAHYAHNDQEEGYSGEEQIMICLKDGKQFWMVLNDDTDEQFAQGNMKPIPTYCK